jgi:hypothetical protein
MSGQVRKRVAPYGDLLIVGVNSGRQLRAVSRGKRPPTYILRLYRTGTPCLSKLTSSPATERSSHVGQMPLTGAAGAEPLPFRVVDCGVKRVIESTTAPCGSQ